jgi:hypothetical protein
MTDTTEHPTPTERDDTALVRALLDYLWNTALIERLSIVVNAGTAVHVRDLFGPEDPLTIDIDEALGDSDD